MVLRPCREPAIRMWEVPGAWKPNVFKKTALTEEELDAAIAASPLNRFFKEVAIPPPKSPLLPLDKGYLGLIMASGMLDGVVEGPRGVHVILGGSHKVEYHNKEASESTENPDTGAVTTKDVYSQRMVTTIRCVEPDGVIYTHSNEPEKDEGETRDRREQQQRLYAYAETPGTGSRRRAVPDEATHFGRTTWWDRCLTAS